MKLSKVEICNYRSIKDLTVSFDEGCQILLGVNESGKTNILRALSLLSPEINSNTNDIRIERKDEPPVDESFVRFTFQLSASQIGAVVDAVQKNFLANDITLPLFTNGSGALTLPEFCRSRGEGLYTADVKNNKKTARYWALPPNFKLLNGWVKLKSPPAGGMVKGKANANVFPLAEATYFFQPEYELLEAGTTEPATPAEIAAIVGAVVMEQVRAELIKCVLWRYTETDNLPSTISADSFAADPGICVPLRSMFELAGYHGNQIGSAITAARAQAPHRYVHLLEKVAESATKHLRRVWKSHKAVNIQLRDSGDQIRPLIIDDQVPLDYANRSDGFKRFVSFLLLISAKVETDGLANTLILVDEPEIALHPSGAKSLMRELIEIGKKNSVVYSTHSIFMVDRENISRHLIVEKKDEVTVASKASRSRIQDEEVLYNAVGFSLFETLKPNNIIFEGWRDKQIYKAFLPSYLKGNPKTKGLFEALGTTFADGVKDVKHVSKILELASRGCLILSDADKPAREKKRQFELEGGHGEWYLLSDIFGHGKFSTGEDFLTEAAILKRSKTVSSKYPGLPLLGSNDLATAKPRIETLVNWLKKAGLDSDAQEEAVSFLKTCLFEKLQRNEIVDDYQSVLAFIAAYAFE